MKIEVLNEFIVLTDCKNYSNAADFLFISQSTLTKHIQQLEHELGVNLIDRSKNSFSLTLDGLIFYEYALKIVQLKQDALVRISSPDSLSKNKVNLNIGTGYLSPEEHTILTRAINSFSIEYPHCSINTVRFNTLNHCKSLLRNGNITLAVIKYSSNLDMSFAIKEQQPDNDLIPLFRSPLLAILPQGHPWLAKPSPLPIWQASRSFLAARNTFRYHDCIATCLAAGFEPYIAHSLDTPESIISFVERGKGVTIAPEALIQKFRTTAFRSCILILFLRSRLPSCIPEINPLTPLKTSSSNIFSALRKKISPLKASITSYKREHIRPSSPDIWSVTL